MTFLSRCLSILGIWTLIGLSFAGQFFIASSQLGRPVSWKLALVHSLSDWYVFALLSPLPIWLARKYGLEGKHWKINTGLHLTAGLLFSILYVLIRAGIALAQSRWEGTEVNYSTAFQLLLIKTWHFNWLIYWVIAGVQLALGYYQESQEKAARNAELERSLIEARLLALQMQLNPHFLFNTLNSVSSLMRKDVKKADQVMVKLSDIIRAALQAPEKRMVPLSQEIEFLRQYLDIEKIRFGERLNIQWEAPPEYNQALIPYLILQPLVENAIRYAIEPYSKAGVITIKAEKEKEALVLEVRDTGPGFNHHQWRPGIGLKNCQDRLKQHFGPNAELTLTNLSEQGQGCAKIRMPWITSD